MQSMQDSVQPMKPILRTKITVSFRWVVPEWWGRWVGSHLVSEAAQGQTCHLCLSWKLASGRSHSGHSDWTGHHLNPSPLQLSGNSVQLGGKVTKCMMLLILILSTLHKADPNRPQGGTGLSWPTCLRNSDLFPPKSVSFVVCRFIYHLSLWSDEVP